MSSEKARNGMVELTIQPELLGVIGSMVPGTKSAVSPYTYGNVHAPDATERSALQQAGVLDAQGAITGNVRDTVETLASTKAYARVRLIGAEEIFEHITYFGDGRPAGISITTTGQGVLVRDPAATDEVIEGVRQYIGESVLSQSTFEAEMAIPEAIAFAAMIDLYRRASLRAIADDGALEDWSSNTEEVRDVIASATDNPQWLVVVVRALSDFEEPLSQEATESALSGLARSGHLVRAGNGYTLGDTQLELGARLLTIDNILTLNAGREGADGQVHMTGFTCLQGGIHDLLVLEQSGPVVRFEALSSIAVLTYLRHFLTDADALSAVAAAQEGARCSRCGTTYDEAPPFCSECGAELAAGPPTAAPVPEASPEPAAPTTVACASCGAQNRAGAAFCTGCGASLSQQTAPPVAQPPPPPPAAPAAGTCPSCGAQNRPTAGFCTSCGTALR